MRKPIVVDKNVFQSWPAAFVPSQHHCILCDSIIAEILDNTDRDLAPKLIKFLRTAPNHYSVAVLPGALVAIETSANTPASPGCHIHRELTRIVREAVIESEAELMSRVRLARESQDLRTYSMSKTDFLDRAKEFAAPAIEERPSWQRSLVSRGMDDPDFIAFIRSPEVLSCMATQQNGYETKMWKKALKAFPDRMAIGRWWRLELYNFFVRTSGASASFQNNYDDMHYAFIASYVGRIATKDKRLRRMVRTLFPRVEICDGVE